MFLNVCIRKRERERERERLCNDMFFYVLSFLVCFNWDSYFEIFPCSYSLCPLIVLGFNENTWSWQPDLITFTMNQRLDCVVNFSQSSLILHSNHLTWFNFKQCRSNINFATELNPCQIHSGLVFADKQTKSFWNGFFVFNFNLQNLTFRHYLVGVIP